MKYAIWDKESKVYTPAGTVYTAEEWMEKYPAAKDPDITYVCSAGKINGAFFVALEMLAAQCEEAGADFSACETDEEKLNAIMAFEQQRHEEEQIAAENAISASERIADAMEDMVVLAMPDEE